jgi:type II secretory pathway pseudopilin PulG
MDWWTALSEIARNFGIVIAGAIGIYLAWRRVVAANKQAEAQTRQAESQIRQSELARRVHAYELFNRAVGQLNDKNLAIRLGAIYTLEQNCRDFPDLSGPVIRTLTTYLQENPVNYGNRKPPADVQAIIGILGNRL